MGTHNLCFLSRNKKNNAYPCKPQFYYIKMGFKGIKIIWACFRDDIFGILSRIVYFLYAASDHILTTCLYFVNITTTATSPSIIVVKMNAY